MGKTSNGVKDKYSRENYKQIKISIKPEIAEAFKSTCEALNVSMASELSGFMANRSVGLATSRPKNDLLMSRGGRRKLVGALIEQLEQIKEAEEGYRDAIPPNLQESIRYEDAEQSLLALEEAIDMLKEAY